MTTNRNELFDNWADRYNPAKDERFPFIGYNNVLDTIVQKANPGPGNTILDIGIGTGNLAQRFLSHNCGLWGIDFSTEMLARAANLLPNATLVQANILAEPWPSQLDRKFDVIVSAYTFHEFQDTSKVQLLKRLIHNHLNPNGKIVIGDIAFPTEQAEIEARETWKDRWDDDEFYWIADRTIAMCKTEEIPIQYTQVSECSGVFIVENAMM